MLPDYLAKATPNPKSNRAPWYVNTAPSYAGIFLWVAFYQAIAVGTLDRAGVAGSLIAIAVAGLLSFALYYYVPAILGMKTGYPLYVVGSSTFGTAGGYLMPGLLMGLLQVGWLSVGYFFSTQYILKGLGLNSAYATPLFIAIAVVWAYGTAYIGIKGIQLVAKVSLFLNIIPFLMILFVFFKTQSGISQYTPTHPNLFVGFTLMIQLIIGFFATAGAAGADFGMSARNGKDVKWGGIVGITIAILYTACLPLLSVAGVHGSNPASDYQYAGAISSIGGFMGSAMFLLFAAASITPSCFSVFIAGNSFATMLPSIPRLVSTMIGVTIAVVLAVTGAAENLIAFFSIVGASFGPICGAMAADYLLSGRKWAGPRAGINWAGYGSWAVGFIVGIIPFLPVSDDIKTYSQPAVVYSFIAGFAVYALLAKAGLQPKTVPMVSAAKA
jgi:cytosine permease